MKTKNKIDISRKILELDLWINQYRDNHNFDCGEPEYDDQLKSMYNDAIEVRRLLSARQLKLRYEEITSRDAIGESDG